VSPPRIMAEAALHGITFELLPRGKLKMASKGKPPQHIVAAIREARDAIVAELARPAVVQGDEAAHDLWLAGTPIADLDHCRFCGSRISWQTDGMAFADGTAAHNRCYEAAVAAGRRWW
jgi:hypothetical protein